MIKFFKLIRQNLLMENKTGKYLKYAFGEIVLVVFGILIALSINNWNQKIKNQELYQSYLKSLITDISQDNIEIENIIKLYIIDSLKISVYRKELTKDSASLDDLIQIILNDWDPSIRSLRSFNTQTYDALVNTGNIDLIEPDIMKSLGNINELQEKYLAFIEEFLDFYRKSGDPSIITSVGSYSVLNEGPIVGHLVEAIDKIRFANYFNIKLTLKRNTYRVCINLLGTIQNENFKLLNLIKEKVES